MAKQKPLLLLKKSNATIYIPYHTHINILPVFIWWTLNRMNEAREKRSTL